MIYKVKVNGKVYEVELEEVESGSVVESKETKEEKVEPIVNGSNAIEAPIAGKIIDIKVNVGDVVKKGDTVAIIEAMKLENEIQSAVSGKVKQINVKAGDSVRNKDILIVLE